MFKKALCSSVWVWYLLAGFGICFIASSSLGLVFVWFSIGLFVYSRRQCSSSGVWCLLGSAFICLPVQESNDQLQVFVGIRMVWYLFVCLFRKAMFECLSLLLIGSGIIEFGIHWD